MNFRNLLMCIAVAFLLLVPSLAEGNSGNCHTCLGVGFTVTKEVSSISATCPGCAGRGKVRQPGLKGVFKKWKTCGCCHGSGVIAVPVTNTVVRACGNLNCTRKKTAGDIAVIQSLLPKITWIIQGKNLQQVFETFLQLVDSNQFDNIVTDLGSNAVIAILDQEKFDKLSAINHLLNHKK